MVLAVPLRQFWRLPAAGVPTVVALSDAHPTRRVDLRELLVPLVDA
jgi:hypothetical protein